MSGVKGKSGRKSGFEEFKNLCILTKTTAWLLNNFDTLPQEEKVRICLAIVPKGIVDKHELSGRLETTQIHVTTINADRLQNNPKTDRGVEVPNKP